MLTDSSGEKAPPALAWTPAEETCASASPAFGHQHSDRNDKTLMKSSWLLQSCGVTQFGGGRGEKGRGGEGRCKTASADLSYGRLSNSNLSIVVPTGSYEAGT